MNPIVSNNELANLVVTVYPDIRLWMDSGISQMPTDKTKYHTTQHVETMLNVLDEEYKIQKFFQDAFTVQDLGKVLVAICWHDVVYVPGSRDNERKSADKWEEYAMSVGGIPSHFVHGVADMIRSTEIGYDINQIKEHPTWAILHDLDYISFASYAAMVMNRPLLRNEFSFLDDAEYTNGRLKFLKSLMDTTTSPGLFLTPVFSKYNEMALENILREYKHYRNLTCYIQPNTATASKIEAPVSSYTDQQHADITLDFFMRLTLILNDWEPEDQLKAFVNITRLILERIHKEGTTLHKYPSVKRVIDIIQDASDEERNQVLMKQIAAAIKRIETYQFLMETENEEEYIITGENEDDKSTQELFRNSLICQKNAVSS